jgi:ABC-type sugar transport system ATPase subunit
MARIELDHVTKVYPGGVPAVNDLSLDIPDGDFMVFVGPSGSGKSTALYPHLTVEENLAFGLQMHKTPKDEQQRRVAEVARMLSGGQGGGAGRRGAGADQRPGRRG